MNFRDLAASVGPRGRLVAFLAATALAVPSPLTHKPRLQPPERPRQLRQPRRRPGPGGAGGPSSSRAAACRLRPKASSQPQDQQIQLIYAPWTKFCLKGQDANAKQVCFTGKDGRIESGQPVVAAVIIEPEGEPKKILRVTLPLGMQLVHGTRIIVDNNPPLQSPYVICFQNGCMSDYEATPELLANMKKGQNLVVQAINSNGAPLTLPLPLQETGSSSPRPMTVRRPIRSMFEETQKKLQEELQKRAEEQRKKLEADAARSSSPGEVAGSVSRRTRQRKGARYERLFCWTLSDESNEPQSKRPVPPRSVQRRIARTIAARFVLDEDLGDLRMPDRLAGIVRQQVLLGDIGDVFGFRVLREQMVERLVLVRTHVLGDRQPPFLGVVEFRIDIEDHAPERENPVANDLADLELGSSRFDHVLSNRPGLWPMLVPLG